MRKIKVLGTDAVIIGSKLKKLRELGVPERERQFRVICGCTGLTDANRQCEAAGLDNRTFQRDYTSETGNTKEIEIAGNGGVFILLSNGNFVSANDLLGEYV